MIKKGNVIKFNNCRYTKNDDGQRIKIGDEKYFKVIEAGRNVLKIKETDKPGANDTVYGIRDVHGYSVYAE